MSVLEKIILIDQSVFHFINRDAGAIVDWIAVAISKRAFGIAIGLLFCGWLLKTFRAKAVGSITAIGLAILIADGIGARLLRPLIGRTRPCYFLAEDTFRWLAPAANGGSLPSLHAANFFALALVGSKVNCKLAWPLYVIATAVSLSRIYLGVHWPLDVLAGAVWGTFSGWVAWSISRCGFGRNGKFFAVQ